jgi:YVTN family beta-propeller protein
MHPSGSPVYIANGDDSLATAIDLNARKVVAEVPVAVEPEGVGVSPDGNQQRRLTFLDPTCASGIPMAIQKI